MEKWRKKTIEIDDDYKYETIRIENGNNFEIKKGKSITEEQVIKGDIPVQLVEKIQRIIIINQTQKAKQFVFLQVEVLVMLVIGTNQYGRAIVLQLKAKTKTY